MKGFTENIEDLIGGIEKMIFSLEKSQTIIFFRISYVHYIEFHFGKINQIGTSFALERYLMRKYFIDKIKCREDVKIAMEKIFGIKIDISF